MTTVVDGGKKAAMVEVNAETDFVAKNEVFQTYVKEVVDQIVSSDVQDVEALKNEKWALDPSMTVAEKHAAMVAKIGENMNIRRFTQVTEENGFVVLPRSAQTDISFLIFMQAERSVYWLRLIQMHPVRLLTSA